ncbi:conserved repeat domain-containing protein [Parafrankia irregularis]|uniref:Conserved repeat domain-containing protein n=1 Tax=Parafrankia irregularis TaxID=795642 RepID=A0A0S4QWS9_9ACTN|nr:MULTISPECIES: DUF11 domain-containing protein [Parafrankia]MBE3205799.1 DUF11 domain-containing protein [Parafrankia sp. CH37]CUU59673.1 conserved repeat domain-containing protein [Parafrankia irregularis]
MAASPTVSPSTSPPGTSPPGVPPLVAARLLGALGAGAFAVAASVLMPFGALAATAATPTPDQRQSGPSLTITVDDGSAAVREGDRRTYTTTIRNIGTTDAEDLVVTLSLPPGTRVDSADGDAFVDDSVVWQADIPRGQTSTFVASLKVGQVPPNQLRLAVVSCVALEDADRPVVCAADSDVLPSAAATDAAHRDDRSDGVIGPLGLAASLATLGGVLVLGVGAALAGRRLLHRRRLVTTGEVTTGEATGGEVTGGGAALSQDRIVARETVEVPAQPAAPDDAWDRSVDHGAVPHPRR